MTIRDRIVAFRRVSAAELVPHPRNWREHPPQQAAAMAAVLAEIGYADALLVRQLPEGRLEILDGHLRAASTPEQLVPVLVLDLSDQEAAQLLLTHDPLAAMARANQPVLSELMDSVSFESESFAPMLASLRERLSTPEADKPAPPEEEQPQLERSFHLAVECADEAEQEQLYRRLSGEGYRVRCLTM